MKGRVFKGLAPVPHIFISCLLFTAISVRQASAQTEAPPWPQETENPSAAKPADVPQRWRALIGEYGPESEPLYILERAGSLWALFGRGDPDRLEELSTNVFTFAHNRERAGRRAVFEPDKRGGVAAVTVDGRRYGHRQAGPVEGSGQLRVKPLRPVNELLKEARAAEPPKEAGTFLPFDLVELVQMDPAIKLDIRYATTNNFLSSIFYSQPRAFLQRPAAEALVRVQHGLKDHGYGLLIHDAYRPWYVTKVFWDATPQDKKWLVADPSAGSRHNRGAAVDLTLYDLQTGRPVEMPSTYDESTPRAYAFYPGGTDLQRWHRAVLRQAMEREGFTVNPREWWHFDYKDWRNYAIGNVPFERIAN